VLGRAVTFLAGGWLLMSAFAWPQSEAACLNTWLSGLLCVVFALLAIFIDRARYLNTLHACVVCLTSLALDDAVSAACANNVMVAAVVFGASLLGPRGALGGRQAHGGAAPAGAANASSTGRPCRPCGDG
jgi:hypothetical protein